MDKRYEQTMLFDFCGELLTDRQREIYEDVVMNDCSLSEVAREYGISRQGVHDMVHRIDRILEEYEEKLQLLKRFLAIREETEKIRSKTDDPEIRAIADRILEDL